MNTQQTTEVPTSKSLTPSKNRSQRRSEIRQSNRNMIIQVINGKKVFHQKKFNRPEYQSHTEFWRFMNKTKRH